MSEELKPCPFCGTKIPKKTSSHSSKCILILIGKQIDNYEQFWKSWQLRPLEDALRAEIADLCYKNSRLKDYEELYHRRGDINGDLVRQRNAMEYERDALRGKLEMAKEELHKHRISISGIGIKWIVELLHKLEEE